MDRIAYSKFLFHTITLLKLAISFRNGGRMEALSCEGIFYLLRLTQFNLNMQNVYISCSFNDIVKFNSTMGIRMTKIFFKNDVVLRTNDLFIDKMKN